MEIYYAIERDLSDKLLLDGCERYSEGVFGKKLEHEAYSWISVGGNDYFLVPLIGVVFPRLNDIMYSILGNISPSVLQYKLPSTAGPPFVVTPLKALLADDASALAWETPNQPLTDDVSGVLYDELRAVACPFFQSNSGLETATTTVELRCKFGRAQKYLYPIAARMLGKDHVSIEYYVAQATNTFTDSTQRETYKIYCRDLIAYLDGGEGVDG